MQSSRFNSFNPIQIVLFIYLIIASFIIWFYDGTGDSGDSITHYLFAKYAPLHPELFFDHWAKPVYVLLASPFAQFGFVGIKIFNSLVTLLTIFISFKIARKLNLKNAILVAVFLICSPKYFVLTFSGLTEPLFALFISISLYATLLHKNLFACILVSFLPFIRSEGLLIIGVYGLYLLLIKEWKLLPLLLFGHFAYSLAGYFVHDDILWVFTKIPYAHLSSPYGSGNLLHFTNQLYHIIGVPISILFVFGIISIIIKSFKKVLTLELQILVFFGFISFFIAHTLFWYLGIFNSMGLGRVLIAVMPLLSIISLFGFNFITEELLKHKRIPKLITQVLLISYILLFPFTSNPAAIHWEKDLKLRQDQRSAIKAAEYIKQNIQSESRFVFAKVYLSEVLNVDYFDPNKRINLYNCNMNHMNSGDIIIWENWSALVDYGVSKECLDKNPDLINIYSSSDKDQEQEILYSVYKHK